MSPELRNRLLIGPLLAASAIGGLVVDLLTGHHYGALILVSLVILLGAAELRQISRHVHSQIPIGPLLVCSLLLCGYYFAAHDDSYANPWLPSDIRQVPIPALILCSGFIWMCAVHMARKGSEDFTRYVGLGMLCLSYLGFGTAMELPLATLPDLGPSDWGHATRGTQLVLLHIVACKAGDVFAFFGGRAFGRHKMAPRVSPGKTWEGFACAMVGAVFSTWLTTVILASFDLPPAFSQAWHLLLWGLLLGALGVLGDLVESCLKRDAGLKDSSQIVPGFGGFLDVFDALILSAPAAYALGLLLG
jgi:phosphatidate cytidylyltransferase